MCPYYRCSTCIIRLTLTISGFSLSLARKNDGRVYGSPAPMLSITITIQTSTTTNKTKCLSDIFYKKTIHKQFTEQFLLQNKTVNVRILIVIHSTYKTTNLFLCSRVVKNIINP